MRNLLPIILVLLAISSCTYDVLEAKGNPVEFCDSLDVSYSTHIVPIIVQSCNTGQGAGTGCHDAWINDYKNLKNRIDNGDIKRVVLTDRTMPPYGNSHNIEPLTQTELDIIECWLNIGAPNN